MKGLLAFTLLLGLTYGQVTPPIPLDDEDPGLRLNPAAAGAQVKLEAFLELNCPDSDYSWPIMQQLAEYYGPEKLDVVIQQLPLPYHRNAYLCTQGLNLVRDQQPDAAVAYITEIFDKILRFGGTITRNMNLLEVTDMLADIQEPVTGIAAESFAADIQNYAYTTVKQWKFGARRGIAGTPWFIVNNVDLAVNPSIRLSYNDWLDILDPLFEDAQVEFAAGKTLIKVEDNINTDNLPKKTEQKGEDEAKETETGKTLVKVEDNINTDNLPKKTEHKGEKTKENETVNEKVGEPKEPEEAAKKSEVASRMAAALNKLKGQK